MELEVVTALNYPLHSTLASTSTQSPMSGGLAATTTAPVNAIAAAAAAMPGKLFAPKEIAKTPSATNPPSILKELLSSTSNASSCKSEPVMPFGVGETITSTESHHLRGLQRPPTSPSQPSQLVEPAAAVCPAGDGQALCHPTNTPHSLVAPHAEDSLNYALPLPASEAINLIDTEIDTSPITLSEEGGKLESWKPTNNTRNQSSPARIEDGNSHEDRDGEGDSLRSADLLLQPGGSRQKEAEGKLKTPVAPVRRKLVTSAPKSMGSERGGRSTFPCTQCGKELSSPRSLIRHGTTCKGAIRRERKRKDGQLSHPAIECQQLVLKRPKLNTTEVDFAKSSASARLSPRTNTTDISLCTTAATPEPSKIRRDRRKEKEIEDEEDLTIHDDSTNSSALSKIDDVVDSVVESLRKHNKRATEASRYHESYIPPHLGASTSEPSVRQYLATSTNEYPPQPAVYALQGNYHPTAVAGQCPPRQYHLLQSEAVCPSSSIFSAHGLTPVAGAAAAAERMNHQSGDDTAKVKRSAPTPNSIYRYLCPECQKAYSCRKNVKRHRVSAHCVPIEVAQTGAIERVRIEEEISPCVTTDAIPYYPSQQLGFGLPKPSLMQAVRPSKLDRKQPNTQLTSKAAKTAAMDSVYEGGTGPQHKSVHMARGQWVLSSEDPSGNGQRTPLSAPPTLLMDRQLLGPSYKGRKQAPSREANASVVGPKPGVVSSVVWHSEPNTAPIEMDQTGSVALNGGYVLVSKPQPVRIYENMVPLQLEGRESGMVSDTSYRPPYTAPAAVAADFDFWDLEGLKSRIDRPQTTSWSRDEDMEISSIVEDLKRSEYDTSPPASGTQLQPITSPPPKILHHPGAMANVMDVGGMPAVVELAEADSTHWSDELGTGTNNYRQMVPAIPNGNILYTQEMDGSLHFPDERYIKPCYDTPATYAYAPEETDCFSPPSDMWNGTEHARYFSGEENPRPSMRKVVSIGKTDDLIQSLPRLPAYHVEEMHAVGGNHNGASTDIPTSVRALSGSGTFLCMNCQRVLSTDYSLRRHMKICDRLKEKAAVKESKKRPNRKRHSTKSSDERMTECGGQEIIPPDPDSSPARSQSKSFRKRNSPPLDEAGSYYS